MIKRLLIVFGSATVGGTYLYICFLVGRIIAIAIENPPIGIVDFIGWGFLVGLVGTVIIPAIGFIVYGLGKGVYSLFRWIADGKEEQKEINVKPQGDHDYQEATRELDKEFPGVRE